jgi:hypothetical protein
MHALALMQVYAKTASLTPPDSSSQVIPDGRRTLIELWVLDAGNRSTAGASGQPCPQHDPCGPGSPSGRWGCLYVDCGVRCLSILCEAHRVYEGNKQRRRGEKTNDFVRAILTQNRGNAFSDHLFSPQRHFVLSMSIEQVRKPSFSVERCFCLFQLL